MSGGLGLSRDLVEVLVAHAHAELPNEACGLLAGDLISGRATRYLPARNGHASPYRYDVHPEDLVRITFEIEAAGEELVAVFHSHPRTPAVPSATDVRDATYNVVHLIVSLAGAGDGVPAADALRGWRIGDATVTEVPIRLSA
jgi:proteasome lid subunit RPN8/RPN11